MYIAILFSVACMHVASCIIILQHQAHLYKNGNIFFMVGMQFKVFRLIAPDIGSPVKVC